MSTRVGGRWHTPAVVDHCLYLDETGTLDFEERAGEEYFGIGTAHFEGDHRAGHLQTGGHRDAIRHAVDDVCQQNAFDRTVVPCIWEAQSSWGIQAADYALWRIQRIAEGKAVPAYTDVIHGRVKSIFRPWGS